jgi:hypothetical protein
MVLYNCNYCLFSSNQKNDYSRHLKTKKHQNNLSKVKETMVMTTNDHKMTPNDHKITPNDHTFKCDFCDLYFSTKPHKRRHELHYCKENTSKMKNKITKLEKEKKQLEKQITKMLDNASTINNNTTNTTNNTNNNTNNIIVVNNYGKENTDYLTVETLSKLLNRPFDSIQDIIKMLHFNAEHPENHNVKITNKKEQYAMVWVNKIWEVRKKKALIKDMVDKGYMMIDGAYDNIDMPNKKYVNFQKQYDDDDSNIKEIIEDETELVIINESKKIET